MVSIEALIQDIMSDPDNKDLTPIEIGRKIDEMLLADDVFLEATDGNNDIGSDDDAYLIEGEHEASFCIDCESHECVCSKGY